MSLFFKEEENMAKRISEYTFMYTGLFALLWSVLKIIEQLF